MKLAPLLISTRDSNFEKGCSLVATALPHDRQGATQTCQCSTRFPCQAHPRLPGLACNWCLHLENPCDSHSSPQRPHELKYGLDELSSHAQIFQLSCPLYCLWAQMTTAIQLIMDTLLSLPRGRHSLFLATRKSFHLGSKWLTEPPSQ